MPANRSCLQCKLNTFTAYWYIGFVFNTWKLFFRVKEKHRKRNKLGLTLIVPGEKPRKGNVDTSYVCKSRVAQVVTLSASEKWPQKLSSGAQLLTCDKCIFANLLQKGKIVKRNETNSAAKKTCNKNDQKTRKLRWILNLRQNIFVHFKTFQRALL